MKKLQHESQSYINRIDVAIKKCYINNPSNEELMSLYLEIGKCICEQGEKAFISHLAKFLKINHRDIKGFSTRNLRRMRKLCEFFSHRKYLLNLALTQSFTINCIILENTQTKEEVAFYLKLAKTKSLSKLKLIEEIKANSYNESVKENEGISNECDINFLKQIITLKNHLKKYIHIRLFNNETILYPLLI